MNTFKCARVTGMTVLAASLALAYGTAAAQENEEVLRQILPESTVRLGLGYLTEDAARFGQYNGLKNTGAYAIGDLGVVRRDAATGTWLRLDGRDLGFESRDLRFEHQRQGNWRYFIEYGKTPRFSPYTVNTGLQGIDSAELTSQNIAPFSGRDVHLKTVREAVTLGGDKALGKGFDVQIRFKNETKEGARLFGRGTAQFLAEPIDQTTQQLDVIFGFTGERLQLSGGYYGSIFKNEDNALWINRGGPAGNNVFSPISLPPDNHAHQFHLAGGYTFTPTTRGNFKVSRGIAYQNDDFMDLTGSGQVINAAAAGRSNLGGKVVTTQAQVGVSSRPLPRLSLLANVRYMDRDDETPIVEYVPLGATGAGDNHPRSIRSTNSKVEASYRLPQEFKLTGGVEHELRKRNTQDFRSVGFRRETEETSYRVELGRSLSETLNGSIAYIRSERDGSGFVTNFNQTQEGILAGTGSNLIAPLHLADRDRNKVRFKLDWTPLEPLSVQFMADFSEDEYGQRDLGPDLGLDKGHAAFWSVDASYTFSDDWQGLAWVSRDSSRSVQRTRINAGPWQADLRQVAQAFGLGVRGNIGEAWKVGGDLQYQHDRSDYVLSGAPITSVLPDVKYTINTLKLFAEYEMRQDLALRVEAIHDQWSTNDWILGLAYADGTRLSQDTTQETTFVGLSMRYNWR